MGLRRRGSLITSKRSEQREDSEPTALSHLMKLDLLKCSKLVSTGLGPRSFMVQSSDFRQLERGAVQICVSTFEQLAHKAHDLWWGDSISRVLSSIRP